MDYDVIIVGAGPGGIFAAYELKKQRPELRVGIFEAGYSLEKRRCPIDGVKIKSCIGWLPYLLYYERLWRCRCIFRWEIQHHE